MTSRPAGHTNPASEDQKMAAAAGNAKTGFEQSLKYISLVTLTVQNATLILCMRHVRTRPGDMFMATTAVIMAELLKAITALVIIFKQEGGFQPWLRRLHEDIILQPLDCMKIAIPSVVYILQNNLLYVAVSNLDAASFQVTYQLKILTTALFSVFMLNKKLAPLQWVALLFLFIGVSVVQLKPNSGSATTTSTAQHQNPILGLIAVVVSCLMSGFAGVYFEKILKGTKQSVWLRNVQLGVLGVVFGLVTMAIKEGGTVREKGFFFGYDAGVWMVIALTSFGGLMVAVVVKYADNILKGFATSAAIILSSILSMYFFNFKLTLQFTLGASLVMVSVYMYSKFVPQVVQPETDKYSTKTLSI